MWRASFFLRFGWHVFFLGGILLCTAACRSPGGETPNVAGPTRIDRLIQRHPELKAGRFAVIADFEDDAQLELFRVENISGRAQWSVSEPRRSRGEEPNRRGVFRSGLPADILCISDQRAAKWHLKRDWREYDLLMFDVESPRDGLRLELTVSTGEPREARTAGTVIRLAKGPNPIRLDLAELSERLALDDIRELCIRLLDSTDPTELILDDIVLTADREDILAAGNEPAGSLYVQRVGRRWVVGANGRFELTFSNGQIVAWYNLAHDPQRLINLVRGTTLGPTVHWPGATPAASDRGERSSVSISSRLVEANAVRAVIETHSKPANGTVTTPGSRAIDARRYTIYPTGEVFVSMTVDPPAEGSQESARTARPSLAIHVANGGESPAELFAGTDGMPTGGSASSAVPFGLMTIPKARASLLFAVHGLGNCVVSAVGEGADVETTSLVVTPTERPTGGFRCSTMMTLSSSDDLYRGNAEVRARGYLDPRPLELLVGDIAPPALGDINVKTTGFDHGSGAYRLRPKDRSVRLAIPASGDDRVDRAFVIQDTQNLEGWVYLNDRIHPGVARDADGNLLFRVPAAPSKKTVVEVLLKTGKSSG